MPHIAMITTPTTASRSSADRRRIEGEIAAASDGRFSAGCGGDTFNTAIYLARAGIDVAFATALGDDSYSDGILALATAEGVASDLVLRVPGRLPGLYLLDSDPGGRR